MFLSINPHAAAARLCAQRDSTLSVTPDGRFIACLPFFNSNLPEYLPAVLEDDYGDVFSDYSAPLTGVIINLMDKDQPMPTAPVNARLERLLLCNRPALYPSREAPKYLEGSWSAGEPTLLYRGRHLSPRTQTATYYLNTVLLEQRLLCAGRGQTRYAGPSQDSTTKPRQDGEGAVTNSVISQSDLQLSMACQRPENLALQLSVDDVPGAYRDFYRTNEVINDGKHHDFICFGGWYDSGKDTFEVDGVSVDSILDNAFWNDAVPAVYMGVKRGRFNSQYTFPSTKSDRDVERTERKGCGDWDSDEMKNVLCDYLDEYGFDRSCVAGSVIPASATTDDAAKTDTPSQQTKHYAHAASPAIYDAIQRVICCDVISTAAAYDGSGTGSRLRELWFANPAKRLGDDEQQELKLLLLSLPCAIVGQVDACRGYAGHAATFIWEVQGGGQLGDRASMAASCEMQIAANTLDSTVNISEYHYLSTGLRDGLAYNSDESASLVSKVANNAVVVQPPPMRTRPMLGNAGGARSWSEAAQGIVFNPPGILKGESHAGFGNAIASDYGPSVWAAGGYAITAMGSTIRLSRDFSSEMPPQHLTGASLGVAEMGVAGLFEGAPAKDVLRWDEHYTSSNTGLGPRNDNHFCFFFTNGGK